MRACGRVPRRAPPVPPQLLPLQPHRGGAAGDREPWAREQAVELGERKWSPHQAKITILEGPSSELEELRWVAAGGAAERESEDVTDSVLAATKPAATSRRRRRRPAAAALRTAAGLADPLAARRPDRRAAGPRGPHRCSRPGGPRGRRSSLSPSERLASGRRELASAAGARSGSARQLDPPTVHFSSEPGGRSSVGRAPGCGPGGRGFESPRSPLEKPRYSGESPAVFRRAVALGPRGHLL